MPFKGVYKGPPFSKRRLPFGAFPTSDALFFLHLFSRVIGNWGSLNVVPTLKRYLVPLFFCFFSDGLAEKDSLLPPPLSRELGDKGFPPLGIVTKADKKRDPLFWAKGGMIGAFSPP